MSRPGRHDVDTLVARIAPDPGPGLTPLARELLTEIVSTAGEPLPPRRHTRWRPHLRASRLVVLAAFTAVLIVVCWVLPGTFGLGTGPASAALDIKRDGEHYIVTLNDVFANPEMYQRELRDRGLDIQVRVEPMPPASVGKATVFDGTREGSAITEIESSGTCPRPSGCPIGFRVPVTFRGRAIVFIGRPARPGERYGTLTAIDSPGGPFHCVDFVNKTVAEVRLMLRARGVTAEFTSYGWGSARPSAPDDWYVHDGVMSAAGRAVILANPTPNPAPRPKKALCPDGS